MREQNRNPGRSDQRAVTSAQVHELKNRLTVIKGMSQLLGRQLRRPQLERARLDERVSSLQNEVVRLEILVNEISRRDDVAPLKPSPDRHQMAYSED
jgi:signal transduction histidine kinase